MKITKIYFPMVTAVRIEGKGMEPRYFSHIPGEPTYPSEDAMLTEEDWRKALREARRKGVRVEVQEF